MSTEGGSLAPALVAQGLGHTDAEGVQRLQDIDLSLYPGDAVVITAQPGGGKSLLLKCLYGLERATAGELELLGRKTLNMNHWQLVSLWRDAGFVFQEGALISNLSIRGNIELPLRHRAEIPESEIIGRSEALLEQFSVTHYANHRPGGLGLAVKKRAALARALAVHPRILFLDEPFAGGDLHSDRLMLGAIQEAQKSWGMAVVMGMSDVDTAYGDLGRIVVLQGGQLFDTGTPTLGEHSPGLR